MRLDDLRTITYLALEQLGQRLDKTAPPFVGELFVQAKANNLIDYNVNDDGSIYVFPLASKPPTQVASVEGIDAHRGMGTHD